MMNASQKAKQRGARCYGGKDYAGAVKCFSEAIERADANDLDLHLYHSNRCAAYQQLGRWREALEDAEATVRIKPGWAKGWSRLGACLERDPRRRGEAAAAYARAAELDPTGRPPPRQSDGLDAVTRVRIWYEGLDGLNKAGLWAAALFALYFLSIIMGGSRRGYAPPRRRTYEREYDDYRPSRNDGLGGFDARCVESAAVFWTSAIHGHGSDAVHVARADAHGAAARLRAWFWARLRASSEGVLLSRHVV